MNTQEVLLNRLKAPYSVDEWSEYVLDEVVCIANRFTDADWQVTCARWIELDAIQQIRMAEIASCIENRSQHIVNMLIDMLSSSNVELIEASLDSLNSLLQCSANFIPVAALRFALSNVSMNDNTGKAILKRVRELVDRELSKTAGKGA